MNCFTQRTCHVESESVKTKIYSRATEVRVVLQVKDRPRNIRIQPSRVKNDGLIRMIRESTQDLRTNWKSVYRKAGELVQVGE